MKKILLCIFTLLLLIIPSKNLANSDNKALIVVAENISFDDLEDMGLNSFGVGLINLKTRKPNDKTTFLTSINVGRKVNLEILESNEVKVDFLGDIFKNSISFFGDENSDLRYLVMDSKFNFTNIDKEINISELENQFLKNDILVIDFDFNEKNDNQNFKKILNENSDKKIYIIPTSLDKKISSPISRQLVPLVISGENGVFTSDSTNRMGLIAIEDISVDIKNYFGVEKKPIDIGKDIKVIDEKDKTKFLMRFYEKIKNLLVISYTLHGFIYFAQVLMCICLYLNKFKRQALIVYIFATNNILLSLILSKTVYVENFYFYFAILLFMNLFLTKSVIKNQGSYKILMPVTYILIIMGMFFNNDIIYNSFVGFNNLMYGVRFYGFNNAMAGVTLVLSIYIMDIVYNLKFKKIYKVIGIIIINLLNLIILSANYGANTGGFITAIMLFILSLYIYVLPKEFSFKSVIYIIVLVFIILGISLYSNGLNSTSGHALEFINRIKQNGFWEFIYIAKFKLFELVRFTIMLPFSLVIVSEILIIKKLYKRDNYLFRLILIISILGFLINDTGNVLFIYIMHYGILGLIFEMMKIKDEN